VGKAAAVSLFDALFLGRGLAAGTSNIALHDYLAKNSFYQWDLLSNEEKKWETVWDYVTYNYIGIALDKPCSMSGFGAN
jgi:hypothetical protein